MANIMKKQSTSTNKLNDNSTNLDKILCQGNQTDFITYEQFKNMEINIKKCYSSIQSKFDITTYDKEKKFSQTTQRCIFGIKFIDNQLNFTTTNINDVYHYQLSEKQLMTINNTSKYL